VVSMDIDNKKINLTTILGERKTLTGTVKYVDFLKHTVLIEPQK
jgi:predicted RNA-binding protein